jgi:hypothetical protein
MSCSVPAISLEMLGRAGSVEEGGPEVLPVSEEDLKP